jgi:hypothetical protein
MRLSSFTKPKTSGDERLSDPEKLIEGLDRKILQLYRPTAKQIIKIDRKKVVMKFNDNLDSTGAEGLKVTKPLLIKLY